VALGFLAATQMQSFDGLLGGLVTREAAPFVTVRSLRIDGLFEISVGLGEPVLRTICHVSSVVARRDIRVVWIWHLIPSMELRYASKGPRVRLR
jgi:hypothetical protein